MNHEIRLYGPIGGFFGYTAEELLAGIPADAKEITVRIHSPGGSVGEGLAIYHALRDHTAKVRTIVDGYAASSASIVMLAGDIREVHRNSIVFVHQAHTATEGNADELRRTADGLDVHDAAILDIYAQRTGMDREELREMMADTAFFRGEDAKDNGFATAVIDDPQAEAQIAAMLNFEGVAAQAKEGIEMLTAKEARGKVASLTEELNAQGAIVEQIKQESVDALAEAKADAEAVLAAEVEARTALELEITALKADAEAVKGELESVRAELATAAEAQTSLTVTVGELQGQVAEKNATITAQKTALASPAYQDAKMAAAAEAKQTAIDAEAEAAEKAAEAETEQSAPRDIAEEYERIEDLTERRAFYAKNKRQILAALESRTD
ncbi:ATP-dependent Clp protease proteolytic subunit [Patescibacteria group bacterium]|nr:ATP-dependent Clp protease proteolytic subunit [Patescibacteria group bacterium]